MAPQHDPDRPWDAFPPDLWRRLLAVAFLESDFDPAEIGADAGLSDTEIAALAAWCEDVAREDEVRRLTGELTPTALKFIEGLAADADSADRDRFEAEVAALRLKARPRQR